MIVKCRFKRIKNLIFVVVKRSSERRHQQFRITDAHLTAIGSSIADCFAKFQVFRSFEISTHARHQSRTAELSSLSFDEISSAWQFERTAMTGAAFSP